VRAAAAIKMVTMTAKNRSRRHFLLHDLRGDVHPAASSHHALLLHGAGMSSRAAAARSGLCPALPARGRLTQTQTHPVAALILIAPGVYEELMAQIAVCVRGTLLPDWWQHGAGLRRNIYVGSLSVTHTSSFGEVELSFI
jgi:hypothetical protein